MFGDDYFPPHALDFMFNEMDSTNHNADEAKRVIELYNQLTENEKINMHEKKLCDLNERINKDEVRLEWIRLLSQGLLATLHGYQGPAEYKRIFEKSIREIVEDAESRDFQLRAELDEEQEWVPS